jgi:hypothetical protein
MTDVLCKLLGGPFDGDEGWMESPLPERLWVEWCEVTGCRHNGIHWHARPTGRGLVYDRGEEDDGVQLYVHYPLTLTPEQRRRRELEPVS